MKGILKKVCFAGQIAVLLILCPVLAYAESAPQDLRAQACLAVYDIIAQCQATATATTKSCTEIAGVLKSPDTRGTLLQRKPGDATDALVDATLAQVVDMCSNACYRAKTGKTYQSAREWIDSGGCTIAVTP
ncbi:MAG TPA: hypothetical protein PLO63_15080 [Syntrophales bacterium]|jgi:hypothetical protein|nr:hypothetical protein [Syntrophales bacterium]